MKDKLKERLNILDMHYLEVPLYIFAEQIKLDDAFFYKYSNENKNLTIITTCPGLWIGKNGCSVKLLEKKY